MLFSFLIWTSHLHISLWVLLWLVTPLMIQYILILFISNIVYYIKVYSIDLYWKTSQLYLSVVDFHLNPIMIRKQLWIIWSSPLFCLLETSAYSWLTLWAIPEEHTRRSVHSLVWERNPREDSLMVSFGFIHPSSSTYPCHHAGSHRKVQIITIHDRLSSYSYFMCMLAHTW